MYKHKCKYIKMQIQLFRISSGWWSKRCCSRKQENCKRREILGFIAEAFRQIESNWDCFLYSSTLVFVFVFVSFTVLQSTNKIVDFWFILWVICKKLMSFFTQFSLNVNYLLSDKLNLIYPLLLHSILHLKVFGRKGLFPHLLNLTSQPCIIFFEHAIMPLKIII